LEASSRCCWPSHSLLVCTCSRPSPYSFLTRCTMHLLSCSQDSSLPPCRILLGAAMWRNLMELQVQAIFLWLFLGFWNGRTLETDVMNGDALLCWCTWPWST
jgi:hypothetical protein